jgi:basic amino acid/polyamine antiporter, APA family
VISTPPSVLGSRYIGAPLLGAVANFEPHWLKEVLRYAVGLVGALVLLGAINGMMLGLSRVTYSLATNRQIPSLLGRLDSRGSTPFVAVSAAALISFGLASSTDVDFLAGIFAFGGMLVFAIAHVSVLRLRFREPERERAVRIPWSIKVRGGSIPVPAAIGAIVATAGWLSVIVLHSGARYVGGAWMLGGIVLYVVYRRSQGKPLRMRFTIPARALQETPETEYGSILVPVFGTPLDDDIVSTAGRLAAEEGEEGEGGSIIEALYIVEVPMSLPLDARVPEEQIERARRAVTRAKEVGEEYEGVTVATAMVRGRSLGAAIVSEAKRRGVEAIVLAADDPPHMRGGALLGGRGGRERSVGAMTRYVVEKAPCRVILTATPDRAPARGGVQAEAGDGRVSPEPDAAPAQEERLPG